MSKKNPVASTKQASKKTPPVPKKRSASVDSKKLNEMAPALEKIEKASYPKNGKQLTKFYKDLNKQHPLPVPKKGASYGEIVQGVKEAMRPIEMADEKRASRDREAFHEKARENNADPKNILKVVVPGHSELDPSVKEAEEARKAQAEQERKEKVEKLMTLRAQTKAKREASGDSVKPSARYEVLGFAVTAVLRWMGKEGWAFEKARKALNKLGGEGCADSTCKIQLRAGKNGERGDPAPISPAQAKELEKASK